MEYVKNIFRWKTKRQKAINAQRQAGQKRKKPYLLEMRFFVLPKMSLSFFGEKPLHKNREACAQKQ